MALRKSAQVARRVPAPSALDASSAIPVFGEFTTVAGQFANTDVIDMIPWPAGTVPIMLKAMIDDIDSATTAQIDFGVLTGLYGAELAEDGVTARACGSEFGNNLTTGQAGGAVDVAANLLLGLAPSAKDRSIGFKVEAAPTLIVGAKIRVAALFVPVPQGVAFA